MNTPAESTSPKVLSRRKSYQIGSIKLHNGSWTLRIRELDRTTGKWKLRRYCLGKFKKEKEAREAAAPIIKQVNDFNNLGPQKPEVKITFKAFIEAFWKPYAAKKKLQISTLDQRNWLLDVHLLPYFGEMLMREVQPSDISKFLLEKASAEPIYAQNTLQAFYGMLRTLFDLAQQNDVIDKSPVRAKLHKPEVAMVEKPTLSAAQIREVLGNLTEPQERLFILLLAVTGIRIGEGLALRWMDFNPKVRELVINHTLYKKKLKEPKTKGSKAKLRLAAQVVEELSSHQATTSFQASDDFIFCRPDGSPLDDTTLRNHLYEAMDKAGIERVRGKYGPHIFRHSAGTLLYEESRDLKLVQGTLRHSDVSTTSDIYVHLRDKVLDEGSEILATAILGTGIKDDQNLKGNEATPAFNAGEHPQQINLCQQPSQGVESLCHKTTT